jgi:site-specific DNA-methyltransferase (adenine-specific)
MSTLVFNQIYNLDCLVGLPQIDEQSIDLVITDPPFAIDFKAQRGNYHRKAERVLEGYHEISSENYYQFTLDWMREVYRVLKDSGSMYVFSGWNNLKAVLNALAEVGFITVNHIIWQYQFGVVTRRRYVTAHYHCLYVCKDDRKRRFYPYARFSKEERDPLTGKSRHYHDKEDVWFIPREYWTGYPKTPTKLPAELIKKILKYSSQEGDVVLDPFLGSGQVAVVSKMLGRQYIGFEINPTYFQFAQARLENNHYLPPRQFT